MTSVQVVQEEVRRGEGHDFRLESLSDIPTVLLGGSAFLEAWFPTCFQVGAWIFGRHKVGSPEGLSDLGASSLEGPSEAKRPKVVAGPLQSSIIIFRQNLRLFLHLPTSLLPSKKIFELPRSSFGIS